MDHNNGPQDSTSTTPETTPVRKPRGFAAMDAKLRSEISRKGGQVAHATKKAHQFTSEEARAAGRKGGQASHARRQAKTVTTTEGN